MAQKKSEILKSDYEILDDSGKRRLALPIEKYKSFDSSKLGLGDIGQDSTSTDAVAAVFDLAGFTNFCKQIEPHLSVPIFLNEFLSWIFEQLRSSATKKETDTHAMMWCTLPFYTKFLGDGLLVLWDVSEVDNAARVNIITACNTMCQNYVNKFLPRIRRLVAEPPSVLRCGIARGTVFSVGNGNDYIGSCINMASRLQKIGSLSFAVNRRGFNLEKATNKYFIKDLLIKSIEVRGIGKHELVAVLKSEFDALSEPEKLAFESLELDD